MAQLTGITHLIIDMDGVLYRGDRPLPQMGQFFRFLRQKPIPFMLATNNSTNTPYNYVEKLGRMGVQISPQEVLTSGQATARSLGQAYPAGTRVHVFGQDSLRQALIEEGFVLAEQDVALVVASFDRNITYEKLKRATLLIRGGARFIATNLDATKPTEEGLIPGTGSMIAALRTATDVEPTIYGKPEPAMFNIAMAQMGARPETTAVIGDRPDTDLLGGRQAGCITIGVLSGAAGRSEMEAFGPDFLFADIAALLSDWQQGGS